MLKKSVIGKVGSINAFHITSYLFDLVETYQVLVFVSMIYWIRNPFVVLIN